MTNQEVITKIMEDVYNTVDSSDKKIDIVQVHMGSNVKDAVFTHLGHPKATKLNYDLAYRKNIVVTFYYNESIDKDKYQLFIILNNVKKQIINSYNCS